MGKVKLVSGVQAVSTDTFMIIRFIDSIPFGDNLNSDDREDNEIVKLAFDVKIAEQLVNGFSAFIEEAKRKKEQGDENG